MRVAFATLGCRLNQFETDSLATQFQEAGYHIVEFADEADAYVINSCTVTNRADRKSRNLFYRAGGSGQAGTSAPLVVLTGCFVESHRKELEGDGRTLVVPNEQKQSIFALVDGHFRGEIVHPTGSVFDFPSPRRIFHTRSMVKIQDGCDNFCAFCIIPQVRGRAQSRAADDVVADVAGLVEGGAREIVLTGVNMCRYSDDGMGFTRLVERCISVPGDFRLRLSSLEPDQLSPRFVELFDHPKMCRHLHLCMQSASERVLLAMRRQYSYAEYREIVMSLRKKYADFNVTTDVIVGFPGETDRDFTTTARAIAEIGFGHVHTFTYSPRSGTPAERIEDQVPGRVKCERSRIVRKAAAQEKRRYRDSLVGKRQRLLVERSEMVDEKQVLIGFGEHYVPIRLVVDSLDKTDFINRFVDVVTTGLTDDEEPILESVPRRP